jgi:hypothetical protein
MDYFKNKKDEFANMLAEWKELRDEARENKNLRRLLFLKGSLGGFFSSLRKYWIVPKETFAMQVMPYLFYCFPEYYMMCRDNRFYFTVGFVEGARAKTKLQYPGAVLTLNLADHLPLIQSFLENLSSDAFRDYWEINEISYSGIESHHCCSKTTNDIFVMSTVIAQSVVHPAFYLHCHGHTTVDEVSTFMTSIKLFPEYHFFIYDFNLLQYEVLQILIGALVDIAGNFNLGIFPFLLFFFFFGFY